MSYTRRTHIVRIYAQKDDGTKDKFTYGDVEVLDAIAFRFDNDNELILNLPAAESDPFILDDTGNGLGRTGRSCRSHIEVVKGDDGAEIVIEVFDIMAYRAANNSEWIINAPSSDAVPYDVTSGNGSNQSTRRTHDEKISSKPNDPHPTSDYLTVERCDMIAMRQILNKELIIKMPSADDGSFARAPTFVSSPENYDPNDDTMTVPENNDPHPYIKLKSGKSPLTGKALISQGPFWWIRKVRTGGFWLGVMVNFPRVQAGSDFSVDVTFGTGAPKDTPSLHFSKSTLASVDDKPTVTADDLNNKTGNLNWFGRYMDDAGAVTFSDPNVTTGAYDNGIELYFNLASFSEKFQFSVNAAGINPVGYYSTLLAFFIVGADPSDPTKKYVLKEGATIPLPPTTRTVDGSTVVGAFGGLAGLGATYEIDPAKGQISQV